MEKLSQKVKLVREILKGSEIYLYRHGKLISTCLKCGAIFNITDNVCDECEYTISNIPF